MRHPIHVLALKPLLSCNINTQYYFKIKHRSEYSEDKGYTMRTILSTAAVILALGFTANAADVINERKANFRANVDALKAIKAAIPAGDTATIAANARKVADWSAKMVEYFPEGSDTGDTKARAEIWFEFDTFTSRAKDAEQAALALASLAESGNTAGLAEGLGKLGGTCKACHKSFKD